MLMVYLSWMPLVPADLTVVLYLMFKSPLINKALVVCADTPNATKSKSAGGPLIWI